MRYIAFIFFIALAGCAANPTPTPDPFDLHLPGPTLAQRVANGYELKNRHIRVVIDDKTGDVIYWGSIDGKQNLLADQPMRFTINDNQSISDGYIEPRDDQTWQYLGEDESHHLGWRKIYCLDGDNLNVSVLVQNKQASPVDLTIGMQCPTFSGALRKDAEHLDGPVHLHAYNEFHDKPASDSQLLLSDPHHLQPAERISWTMQWRRD